MRERLSLPGFRGVVRALGGDPEAEATRAGLSTEALDGPLSVADASALLESTAVSLQHPDLGLLLDQHQVWCGATDFGRIVDDPRGARRVIGFRLDEMPDVLADVLLLRLHRWLGDYGPRSVELRRLPPREPRRWSAAFGATVHFRQPANMLRLPAGLLSTLQYAEHPARPVLPRPRRSDTARRVRDALSRDLAARAAMAAAVHADEAVAPAFGLAEVARQLSTHPRTLQRSLAEEGLLFANIQDCVRRDQALRFLTGTDLPLARIAFLLGLADPSVLSRCTRRWFGTTPGDLRQRSMTGSGSAVIRDTTPQHG